MLIGERIRKLRIHKGMNQSEFVQGICSITYLSKIENGKINPSKSFIKKLSKRLDINLEFINNNNLAKSVNDILDIIKNYKENNILSDGGISLLEIHAIEMHPLSVLLQVYGVLIHNYTKFKDIKSTDRVYQLSQKIIPKEISNDNIQYSIYYYISCGNYFYMKQDYFKSNEYYVTADKLIGKEETELRANLYYNLSLVKQRILKNQNISRFYSFKAYNLFNKMSNKKSIISCLITIGVQYHLDQMYAESIEYISKAEKLVDEQKVPDNNLKRMIEYNYGRICQGKNDYDQAISHFTRCISMSDKENEKEKIHSLKSLIEIHITLKDWNKVSLFLNEALSIVEKYNLHSLYIDIHIFLTEIYKTRGDDLSYEKEMQHIIEFALKNNHRLNVKKQAQKIADHYFSVSAYKMSAKYYKLALTLDNVEEKEYQYILENESYLSINNVREK